jgi:hypothetical protein
MTWTVRGAARVCAGAMQSIKRSYSKRLRKIRHLRRLERRNPRNCQIPSARYEAMSSEADPWLNIFCLAVTELYRPAT